MTFNQQEFDVRCEWGERGLTELAPVSNVLVIVDVFSFSTSVDIAVSRGAMVVPYQADEKAAEFAASIHAELARPERTESRLSLSPASLLQIPRGTRIVLPSLNGARLSLLAGPVPLLAGCLRNARAVATAAQRYGSRISVIAAGERWKDDDSLRPALEDLIGAGAIISHLGDSLSPEAMSAKAVFRGAAPHLLEHISRCGSGKELIEGGFAKDVGLASELDVSGCAPTLIDGTFACDQA